ncbi:MAG: cytochrome c [Alphaproteobacteria bacterium]|nr:cytochrome c [Alphaproteobacteria bacterium]MBU1515221.1 cytochrome c [Alphaproteobacteria bacterium]MBU2092351.1 cytochrome c [Alphaproteobacteria bacterium]MBU2152945.1 cytochrome c [Alphaproteobacteria bacterium]MBU2305776.1 cytochrome c [Alphaproteobacteria bacterium]
MFRKSAVLAIVGLLAICSATEAAVLTVKEEMKQFVEPLSNTLFAVGGEVDPANGPDAPKVTDKRWDEAADAADVLTRVSAALGDKDRAKPGPEWAAMAQQMHEISERALKAAMTRDGAGLAQAANDLSDNCSACHAKFKPQTGD